MCSAILDHKLICFFFPPLENLGPLPFRFNHLWLESKGVRDIISKAWLCFIPGSPDFIWEQNLKRVKSSLNSWATHHYQEPSHKKIEIVKKMEALQENMEKDEITREHLLREIELEKSLQSILRQEEEGWRLRSRVLWLKGGDQNTKLFQNQCRER